MTTFQDPPPQSRRAIRLAERAETNGPQQTTSPETSVAYNQFTGEQPPAVNPTLQQTPVSQPSGRRSRAASPDGLVDIPTTPPEGFDAPQAEPLTYATQGSPVSPEQSAPVATPTDQPYRVRDFSPEGRRAAQQSSAQPAAWQKTPQQSPDAAPLDYRTQAGPPVVSAPPVAATPAPVEPETPAEQPEQPQAAPSAFLPPSQVAPQPTSHAVPTSTAPVEQTMSRRELRAQLAAAEAAAAQASAPFAVPALVEPEPETSSASALSNAMAEFDALTRTGQTPDADSAAQAEAEARESEARDAAAREAEAREVEAREQAARDNAEAAQRHAEAEEAARHARELQEAQATEARLEQEKQLAEAQARVDAQASNPVELSPQFVAPEVESETYATTTGHWSRQADLDDEIQPFENTLSRDVGGGNVATTTSALVLPVIPPSGFSAPFGTTGEILVTGSIDLPRSLGTTGGDARRYDDPDVDNLFDAFDNEIINTDSAPVRAIRAVSTHTSTQGVIQTAKPQGNRMLTGLLITTGALAVVVVGLLITAFATGIF